MTVLLRGDFDATQLRAFCEEDEGWPAGSAAFGS
jgi:hypothetical protein